MLWVSGFMGDVKVFPFVKGGADEMRTLLFKKFTERAGVLACFSY
jgi:hypothetical protein